MHKEVKLFSSNCINASTYIVNKQPVGLVAQNPLVMNH